MDTCTVTFSVQRILVTFDVELELQSLRAIWSSTENWNNKKYPIFQHIVEHNFLLFFMLKIIVFRDVHPVVW